MVFTVHSHFLKCLTHLWKFLLAFLLWCWKVWTLLLFWQCGFCFYLQFFILIIEVNCHCCWCLTFEFKVNNGWSGVQLHSACAYFLIQESSEWMIIEVTLSKKSMSSYQLRILLIVNVIRYNNFICVWWWP